MRILFLTDVFFPRVNGVSTSIASFRNELARRGHDVRLVAPSYDAETPEPGLVRVPARPVPFDPEDRWMRPSRMRAAARVAAADGVDLVHVHTPFVAHGVGVEVARELGVPLVLTYHTFFEEYLHHYVPLVPRVVLKGLARRVSDRQCGDADAVLVPSSALRDVLVDYGVEERRLTILPTGLPLAELSGGDGERFRARHGIPPQRPTLVHVGRVAHEKNLAFVLEVVARVRREIPEVLLILAGEGPARPALERLAGRRHLLDNVLFVGNLDRARELLDCYRAGDAFVFASRTETQGLVLLEAMALEVPVVSTAVLGTRDVLREGRGAVIVPEDVDAFARAVADLLRDPERRRRLGHEGLRWVREAWTVEATTSRLVDLYERSVGADARAAAG